MVQCVSDVVASEGERERDLRVGGRFKFMKFGHRFAISKGRANAQSRQSATHNISSHPTREQPQRQHWCGGRKRWPSFIESFCLFTRLSEQSLLPEALTAGRTNLCRQPDQCSLAPVPVPETNHPPAFAAAAAASFVARRASLAARSFATPPAPGHRSTNTMTEAWRSNPMHWCDVCRCWLQDNRASRLHHERGARHVANLQQR